MRYALAVTCLILLPPGVAAQAPSVDLSIGLSGHAGRGAVTGLWATRLGPLSLGAGPRLTWYRGSDQLLHRQGDKSALLPDTVRLDPSVLGLNLVVAGELVLGRRLALGANLDLAGAATGPGRDVSGTTFKPASGSIFRYGHSDRGSLNSEFYGKVTFHRWALRAGVSHYVIGYRASSGGTTNRYDRFTTVPFVAVSVSP